MPRKVIQIATTAIPANEGVPSFENIVALCDDGSIWVTNNPDEGPLKWTRVCDVPQE